MKTDITSLISVKHLSKAFGDECIFDDFNCDFPPVGLYYLVGESGKGKTTLLRILAGLDTEFTGDVTVPERVSFLFQDKRLFPTLSAIENLTIISDEKGEAYLAFLNRAKMLLQRMNIHEEDYLKKPSQLSGGMQQRIAIARAILFDAPVLLLDEPSKELDEENKKILREIVLEESARRLVIAVTHNAEDVKVGNAIKIEL